MLHGFTLTHPIELPTVRNTRIRSAQLGKTSSELAKAEMRLAVRGGVKQSFYEVLRRKGEVELSRTNLRLVEELRGRIETQVKVGEAARLELTRADAPAILPPLETLRDEVMAQHPSIALAESEARRAGLQLDFQRAQKTPQPSVWADVLKQPDSSQYRFGVTVDLPVWNRREGPIAEAVASQRQAEALVGQRRVEISAALDRAYSLYQIAGQQVEMFEAGTLRQAEAALKAAEAAFRFGERSIIEVLDAQRVLRAARLDYLNAQYDRQQALIELEQLRALPGNGEKP
jgi:cobalt-zinc-cadmium efflux system outer membrane protein